MHKTNLASYIAVSARAHFKGLERKLGATTAQAYIKRRSPTILAITLERPSIRARAQIHKGSSALGGGRAGSRAKP
jgi:hypothetical protein